MIFNGYLAHLLCFPFSSYHVCENPFFQYLLYTQKREKGATLGLYCTHTKIYCIRILIFLKDARNNIKFGIKRH